MQRQPVLPHFPLIDRCGPRAVDLSPYLHATTRGSTVVTLDLSSPAAILLI
jgi:crotonobetainyl-CoA:carnitine CoA-transferase CaiB-like acyl-CoA transferase